MVRVKASHRYCSCRVACLVLSGAITLSLLVVACINVAMIYILLAYIDSTMACVFASIGVTLGMFSMLELILQWHTCSSM